MRLARALQIIIKKIWCSKLTKKDVLREISPIVGDAIPIKRQLVLDFDLNLISLRVQIIMFFKEVH